MALTKVGSVGIATGISLTGVTTTQDAKVGTGITLSPDGDGYYTGIITATKYYGDGSTLSNITTTTINNNADNRLITGSGTANTLEAEANLTFANSGSDPILTVTNSGHAQLQLTNTSATDNCSINFGDDADTDAGEILYNHANNRMVFYVNGTEAARFTSAGKLGLNETSPAGWLHIHQADSGTNDAIIITNTSTTNNGLSLGVSSVEDAFFWNGSNTNMTFATNNTERLRIDSSGRFLLGTTSSESVYGINHQFQVEGTNGATSSISLTRNSNNADSAYLTFAKTRGTADGEETIVQSGDTVGVISFNGADGTNKDHMAAQIKGQIDGTPGENDLPGRLVFTTTADGANSSTERMRIDSSGDVIVANTFNSNTDISPCFSIGSSSNARPGIVIRGSTSASCDISFCDNSGTDSSEGVSEGLIRYDHSADAMYFHTADEERLRIDSSGRLLLGATKTHSAASYYDDIVINNSGAGSGAAGGCGVSLISHPSSWGAFMFGDSDDDDLGYMKYDHSNDAIKFGTTNTDRALINSDGLAIAQDGSPATAGYVLRCKTSHANGGNVAQFYNDNADNYGGLIISAGVNDREVRLISAYGSSFMTFYTESAGGAQNEWMRIKQDGHVNFHTGGNSPGASQRGAQFEVNGTNTILQLSAGAVSSGNHIEFYNTNGQVGRIYSNNSATTYSTSSDYRLKENTVAISDGITRVKALKPYRFNWKSDASKTTIDGFFAHEVSPVVPEAIGGVKDAVEPEDNEDKKIKKGDIIPQSIDQSKLVPLLTAALQEAIAKIETLETKVAALESA